jgi:pyruvate/2-oxoglutarate dehydrogenase complex dihydrolipoamide dehydrogenase (E3) component
MVAASLGAQVTIIERAGLGGSAVLTDVVPSKTLIATADLMTRVAKRGSWELSSTSTAATLCR